jgi:hypothetical protein
VCHGDVTVTINGGYGAWWGVLGLNVPSEVDLALESPAAPVAGEGFESGVFSAVGDEVGGLAECLAALETLVGLLACKYKVEKS